MLGLERSVVFLVLRRPTLLRAVVGLAWACRPRDWYRRFPFLPIPPTGYLRWRMETAYGNGDAEPPPEDMARFLQWSSRMRRGI